MSKTKNFQSNDICRRALQISIFTYDDIVFLEDVEVLCLMFELESYSSLHCPLPHSQEDPSLFNDSSRSMARTSRWQAMS